MEALGSHFSVQSLDSGLGATMGRRHGQVIFVSGLEVKH